MTAIADNSTIAPLASSARTDWIGYCVIALPLLAATVFSKIGVPPMSQQGISIAVPLMFLALALGLLTGRLTIEPKRFALYSVTVALLALPQLLIAGDFSVGSLILLAALHLQYIFVMKDGAAWRERCIALFLFLSAMLSVLALMQFALQTVIDASVLFPIENFLPADFMVHGFNSQGLVSYGSHFYRANGVFMLEPSFLTQFLAIAIIAEALTFKRAARIVLYCAAIIVAYSGTGILILLVCGPILIVSQRRWDLIVWGAVIAIIAVAAGELLQLDVLTSRSKEFTDTNSSGFARFVGGFYLFDVILWDHPWRALFGYGAGAYVEYAHLSPFEAADMPLFKMVVEFGVVGAAIYFAFLARCLFSSGAPRLLCLAVALTFLLNGLYVPSSHAIALSLLILTSSPREGATASSVPRLTSAMAPAVT